MAAWRKLDRQDFQTYQNIVRDAFDLETAFQNNRGAACTGNQGAKLWRTCGGQSEYQRAGCLDILADSAGSLLSFILQHGSCFDLENISNKKHKLWWNPMIFRDISCIKDHKTSIFHDFPRLIHHFPVVFSPRSPQFRSRSDHRTGLQPRLTGLRKLTASYNALSQLPESIGECQLLEKIRVVNNHITAAWLNHGNQRGWVITWDIWD